MAAYLYGLAFGVGKIVVRHVDVNFADLPEEFDGFRVLQISDIHTGTFNGWRRKILRAEIDSVRAQKDIDLVCFTGDIENMQPGEVEAMMPELKRLPYMYSVLGNHDYAEYTDATPAEKKRMTQKVAIPFGSRAPKTTVKYPNRTTPISRRRSAAYQRRRLSSCSSMTPRRGKRTSCPTPTCNSRSLATRTAARCKCWDCAQPWWR